MLRPPNTDGIIEVTIIIKVIDKRATQSDF